MSLGGLQKVCLWSGYYLNAPARQLFASGEKVERYARRGEWGRVTKEVAVIALLIIPSIPGSLLGTLCYGAASLGSGRFVYQIANADCHYERRLRYACLNTCFQYPYSPLTGGMEQPFDPVGGCASRIEFVAQKILQKPAAQQPALVVCQEVENLGAQKEFAERFVQAGYSVLYDTGADSLLNPSGLFIAFYGQIRDYEFIPYPPEMRVGLARWSRQGALAFKVTLDEKEIWIATTHLNYGDGADCESARQRQLDHLTQALSAKKEPYVILGDLNSQKLHLPDQFMNALQGQMTCTDAGKHRFRKPFSLDCPDCREQIDGVLYPSNRFNVTTVREFLLDDEERLVGSDHALITGAIFFRHQVA